MHGRLREAEALAHVHGSCFTTGPPHRTGVELEWLVRDGTDPARPVPPERLAAALAPLTAPNGLPHGSTLTREPGGQVELSSPPAPTLAGCVETAAADMAVLRRALASCGLRLLGCGLDPDGDPPRVVDTPRYRAMEAHFDRCGPWGRVMMCGTAAVQVSLDAGDDTDGPTGYRYRWRTAHRIGPVLVAAFANSPLRRGKPTGWCSTRQAAWGRTDPTRTRQPRPDSDPRAAWAAYALDAQVLCLRRPPPADWVAPPGLTFRGWLAGARRVRPPTLADLDYHLGTLFPPVRPRGWLELRMIDAQPGDGWTVPTALAAILLDDPAASDAAYAATDPLCPDGTAVPPHAVWLRAARSGPTDPDLGKAVRACFAAAEAALLRSGAPSALREAVSHFAERYAGRGRCPAHDWLDAVRDGRTFDPEGSVWR